MPEGWSGFAFLFTHGVAEADNEQDRADSLAKTGSFFSARSLSGISTALCGS